MQTTEEVVIIQILTIINITLMDLKNNILNILFQEGIQQ